MEVKIIDAHLTYDLRHRILRPHQSLHACHYPLDYELTSLHLGAYLDQNIISVASFFKENHPDLDDAIQYRLRGMATEVAFRGQGAGTALLQFADNYLRQKKASIWWCNARTTAAGYYEKQGMEQLGSVFEIEPIGPHKVMVKKLS
ncbi:MAG: GNAT family N-acetyltransferase [Bacteroidota bacterium]